MDKSCIILTLFLIEFGYANWEINTQDKLYHDHNIKIYQNQINNNNNQIYKTDFKNKDFQPTLQLPQN